MEASFPFLLAVQDRMVRCNIGARSAAGKRTPAAAAANAEERGLHPALLARLRRGRPRFAAQSSLMVGQIASALVM